MKSLLKLGIIALAAVPAFASAQTYLYIPTQEAHYDIDGVTGGGPFMGEVLSGPSKTVLATETLFCDSINQEFYLGQTFQVKVEALNTPGSPSVGNPSLDPWVITKANSQASLYDTANHTTLTQEQIVSAVQGVIWSLDGDLSGTLTSGNAGTASFANYLLNAAKTTGSTNVKGFAKFDAGPNYSNPSNPTHQVQGQSQIGCMPVPEPSAVLILALPLLGVLVRKRRVSKA